MIEFISMRSVIEASYFIAAILFIFGLKRMSSPVTARGGIIWAGAGMVVPNNTPGRIAAGLAVGTGVDA